MPNTSISEGEKKPSLLKTILHAMTCGVTSGAAEVACDHPLWTLKTRYQDPNIPKSEKLTFNLRTLYRGVGPNMLSMMPITGLQVGCAKGLKAALSDPNKPPSNAANLGYSFTGGALSALVSGPTELVMSKQTKGKGFFPTAIDMVRSQGWRSLTTGLAGTAARDGKFAAGYLFGGLYMKNKLKPYCPEEAATFGGGMIAGAVAAALSQPDDTIKTMQQTTKQMNQPVTPYWTLGRKIVKEQGMAGLYRGSIPRCLRVFSAINIMGWVNNKVEAKLKKAS